MQKDGPQRTSLGLQTFCIYFRSGSVCIQHFKSLLFSFKLHLYQYIVSPGLLIGLIDIKSKPGLSQD